MLKNETFFVVTFKKKQCDFTHIILLQRTLKISHIVNVMASLCPLRIHALHSFTFLLNLQIAAMICSVEFL